MFVFSGGMLIFFMVGGALRSAGDARTPMILGDHDDRAERRAQRDADPRTRTDSRVRHAGRGDGHGDRVGHHRRLLVVEVGARRVGRVVRAPRRVGTRLADHSRALPVRPADRHSGHRDEHRRRALAVASSARWRRAPRPRRRTRCRTRSCSRSSRGRRRDFSAPRRRSPARTSAPGQPDRTVQGVHVAARLGLTGAALIGLLLLVHPAAAARDLRHARSDRRRHRRATAPRAQRERLVHLRRAHLHGRPAGDGRHQEPALHLARLAGRHSARHRASCSRGSGCCSRSRSGSRSSSATPRAARSAWCDSIRGSGAASWWSEPVIRPFRLRPAQLDSMFGVDRRTPSVLPLRVANMRVLLLVSPLLLAASLNAQQPEQLKALRWRSVGPANNAGRVSVVAGVPGNRDVYYVAGANGGIIKTIERRHHVQADLRQGACRIDRRDRRRAERSEHHLRRHGRRESAQQRVDRRRHVQVRRRGRALDAHRAGAERQDRAHRRRREESGPRLRVRTRARVGAERGARRVQDHRRRQDVAKGALRRLADRLLRHRGRSGQLEHSLRGDVHVPPLGVASRVGRRQHGGVSLGQRRRDVGAPLRQGSRARSPEDGHGPHRHRGGAERSVDRVRDQRDEDRGRAVALGRRAATIGAR